MRSMTGHGIGKAPVGEANKGTLEIELRTVNHRFLDVRVRTPRDLADLGPYLEQLARESLARGRLDIALRAELPAGERPLLDRDRARTAWKELLSLRDELAPGTEVPFSMLAAVPELFSSAQNDAPDAIRIAVKKAFDLAIESLAEMRAREGVALAADLRARMTRILELADLIAARSPEIIDAQRKRLRERADRLKAAVDNVDSARLEAEIVVFAERVDVAEELTRLRSHCEQLEALLSSENAVGRRLEFLLQEMQREANTTAAKSGDARVSHAVVEIKAELERMREQVQNIE